MELRWSRKLFILLNVLLLVVKSCNADEENEIANEDQLEIDDVEEDLVAFENSTSKIRLGRGGHGGGGHGGGGHGGHRGGRSRIFRWRRRRRKRSDSKTIHNHTGSLVFFLCFSAIHIIYGMM